MIGFFKNLIEAKQKRPSRPQVLGARPLRNPAVEWEREVRRDDGEPVAMLKIPRRSDKWGNIVAKIFRLPEFRKLELDEIGSDVWEMCDGETSVEQVTKAVCEKYKLNRRQGETSVTAYLRLLAERRLLALKKGSAATAGAGRTSGAARKSKKR